MANLTDDNWQQTSKISVQMSPIGTFKIISPLLGNPLLAKAYLAKGTHLPLATKHSASPDVFNSESADIPSLYLKIPKWSRFPTIGYISHKHKIRTYYKVSCSREAYCLVTRSFLENHPWNFISNYIGINCQE